MRPSFFKLPLAILAAVLIGISPASAQEQATPLQVDNGTPVPEAPAVAYEKATLPSDRDAAWAMVRAANGLRGDTLAPWYLHAKYQAFDAYGHSKAEGTLDYLWMGRDSWHVTYTEAGAAWTQWKTADGVYAPAGQHALEYPESLIVESIARPLDLVGAPEKALAFHVDQNFSALTLSCFRTTPLPFPGALPQPLSSVERVEFCTAQGRPVLRILRGGYTLYLNKPANFQHRLLAMQLLLGDDETPVLEVNLDTLRTPTPAEQETVKPPPSAVLVRDTSLLVQEGHLGDGRISRPEPSYPEEMRRRRIQGVVRFAARIGTDGKVHDLELLHSPDPGLTKAAESAVSRWTYKPYLVDGKPTDVHTRIAVRFYLSH